jgi:hypothetical protein
MPDFTATSIMAFIDLYSFFFFLLLWRNSDQEGSDYSFFNWYIGEWSRIGSTRHCCHQWPIVPAPGDYDDGEIGGMIGRGNRSIRRKPALVPHCPPQTPRAVVGSQPQATRPLTLTLF